MNRNLVEQIRKERTGRKRKEPLRQSLFQRIVSIVRHYELTVDFLRSLEEQRQTPFEEILSSYAGRPKEPLRPLLFPLGTEDEFLLSMEIIARASNPYLYHAHSPDEIALSGMLYARNPSIEPERLERIHFGALLSSEAAGEETATPENTPGITLTGSLRRWRED